MSFVQLYFHVVFPTKFRYPFLDSKELRRKVWTHIKENSKDHDYFVDCVNGYSDHCHCLISFGACESLATVVQLIKGESSYWVNMNGLTIEPFEWQPKYWASSVSPSNLEAVRHYIFNQEKHHSKIDLDKELFNLTSGLSPRLG